MDVYGWFIATLHQLLGHDQCAAALGQPANHGHPCLLCIYEAAPSEANRQAVEAALARAQSS